MAAPFATLTINISQQRYRNSVKHVNVADNIIIT